MDKSWCQHHAVMLRGKAENFEGQAALTSSYQRRERLHSSLGYM